VLGPDDLVALLRLAADSRSVRILEKADRSAFVSEEPAFAVDTEAIAAERSTGAHPAMARDHDADRVRRIGGTDRACGVGCADPCGEFAGVDGPARIPRAFGRLSMSAVLGQAGTTST